MALGNSATVRMEIVVDDNGTPTIRRFQRETEGAADRAGRAMEGFGTTIGRVATAMAALGGMAVAGLAGVAGTIIKTGNEFASAQRKMRAQTEQTEEQTEKLGRAAQRIYGDTFAASVGDAMETVRMAFQTLKGATDSQVEYAASVGQKLSDAFEIDPEQSISAMKTLMDNYGMTVEQAADMIAGLPRPVTITWTEGGKRTLSQNALLHKWYGEIASQLGDMTAVQVKGQCHLAYGVSIKSRDAAWAWVWKQISGHLTYEQKCRVFEKGVLAMTSTMTTKELTEYMDAMAHDYRAQGVHLTAPEDTA